MENQISRDVLDITNANTRITQLQDVMNQLNAEIYQKNEDISKIEGEIIKRNAVIERKQGTIDQLNKKIDQIKSSTGVRYITTSFSILHVLFTHPKYIWVF